MTKCKIRCAALAMSLVSGTLLTATPGHAAPYDVQATGGDDGLFNIDVTGQFDFDQNNGYSNLNLTVTQRFSSSGAVWTQDTLTTADFVVDAPNSAGDFDGLSSLDINAGGAGSATFPEKLSQVSSDSESMFLLNLDSESEYEWTAISLVFDQPLTSGNELSLVGAAKPTTQQGSGFGGGSFGSLNVSQDFALQGTVSQGSVTAVPVPASLGLLGVGLVGLGLVARRRTTV